MSLPNSVQMLLTQHKLQVNDVLILKFDVDWNWTGYTGELANFALNGASAEEVVDLVRALCVGLKRTRGGELKLVGLPNGVSVDLRLASVASDVYVVMSDARAEVEQTRVWQQSAQESELRSYEKSREIRKQRVRISDVRSERDLLAWQLALERARRAQLQSELTTKAQLNVAEIAAIFNRLDSLSLSREHAQCTSQQLVTSLSALSPPAFQIDQPSSACLLPFEIGELTSVLLPLLMFAHRKSSTSVEQMPANLSVHADYLLLSVFCGMADLSKQESTIVWQAQLPDTTMDLLPSHYPLVLLADRQKQLSARVTRQFDAVRGLWLAMSIPFVAPARAEPSPSLLAGTKLKLAVGAELALLSEDPVLCEQVRSVLNSVGFTLKVFGSDTQLRAASIANVLMIDLRVPEARAAAYWQRSAGFGGRIIAIGELRGGPAVRASFDSVIASAEAELLVSAITR